MKKSTGVIMIIVIVLLLGVIGVGGYFLIKGNNDSNKQIGELKNEVANLGKSNENTNSNQVSNTEKNETVSQNTSTTTSTQNTTNTTTQSVRTMKDVAGNYKYEIKDDSGYPFGAELYLANDGTFGCFYEVGGITGSYSIEGDVITLNVIFSHGGGVGLDLVKEKKVLTIKDNGSLETKDIHVHEKAPETITLNKVSNTTSDFDIRTNIRGSIGTGPEYHFTYNY